MSKTKSINKIPKGIYCYDENGVCPYWSIHVDRPEQENGHCRYLEVGDWEYQDGWISLLWDQVKECGLKVEDSDPMTDEENDK